MIILNHKLLFHTKEVRGIADRINGKRNNGEILAPFRLPTPHKKKKENPYTVVIIPIKYWTWDSISTYITNSN